MDLIDYTDNPFQRGRIYGLNINSMRTPKYWYSNRAVYDDKFVVYEFDSYWLKNISKNSNREPTATLCKGTVTFEFNDVFAREIDNRDTYKDMHPDEVLSLGRVNLTQKDPEARGSRTVKYLSNFSRMQFGYGSAWVSDPDSLVESDFKELVDLWFDLPSLPEDYSWVKFKAK